MEHRDTKVKVGLAKRLGRAFLRLLFSLLLVEQAACGNPSVEHPEADKVVLLHGLGRTDLSMLRMENALKGRGYEVVNVSYPSTQYSIEQLAREELGPAIEACCSEPGGKVHFVTHSMGGIVLRYYLENHATDSLGRVVMLSPPNQGSEVADWVAENPILETILGPWPQELGTGPESVPGQLGPVDFELGIIAGNKTLNPLFSRLIPGADDGKVAVEATKVEGMTDFLVVPRSHTYIMMSDDVIAQVLHFLEHGEFRHADTEADSADSGESAPTSD
ncbi:MAG: alpha/beta fold hydrolase [Gemmatimonadetes bacterium]|nr:alpha/beta fold hydrolase [Gemmatimonadota bacterium]NIO32176.1 alpha/beta fold hydrolase [Gemmatimonadota bacterium]